MRADARAKRQALVSAAWELYAERGAEVPLSTVAREAGVGIATLYRHFPTTDDLLVGVLCAAFERIDEVVQGQLEHWSSDPADTWSRTVHALGDLHIGALAYRLEPRVTHSPEVRRPTEPVRERALAGLARLLALAADARLVSRDLTVEQFFAGLSTITRPLPESVITRLPEQRSWLIDVYLAGLLPARPREQRG